VLLKWKDGDEDEVSIDELGANFELFFGNKEAKSDDLFPSLYFKQARQVGA
jgi:hypothetical protein